MTTVITVVFLLHSLLCIGYTAYLARSVATWAHYRLTDTGPATMPWEGPEDWILLLTGHVTLLMYLVYAESYLAKLYAGM
jgi:hypothetical protein